MENNSPKPHFSRGLSLVEALIVIVAIGIIVAIALPVIGNLRESAQQAASMQNAKNVAQLSEALAAFGVAHVIPDSMGGVEATARLMREGIIVPEGPMAGEKFVLSGMRDNEIADVARYLTIRYGEKDLQLVFRQNPGSTLIERTTDVLYAAMADGQRIIAAAL